VSFDPSVLVIEGFLYLDTPKETFEFSEGKNSLMQFCKSAQKSSQITVGKTNNEYNPKIV